MGLLVDGVWQDHDRDIKARAARSCARKRVPQLGDAGRRAGAERQRRLSRPQAGRYHLYVVARLPVGAPHADLPRAEGARGRDLALGRAAG